jgi:hypothetical protein
MQQKLEAIIVLMAGVGSFQVCLRLRIELKWNMMRAGCCRVMPCLDKMDYTSKE